MQSMIIQFVNGTSFKRFLFKHSDYYSNKLKVASILWKEVRVSKNEKNIQENF